MGSSQRTAIGLGLAAAVCLSTPVLATAAPTDSGYANCDGGFNCDTGDWPIGGGNVWVDYTVHGLPGSSIRVTLQRNDVGLRSCTWSIALPPSGSLTGTRGCDFGSDGQVNATIYSPVAANPLRIGWHQ